MIGGAGLTASVLREIDLALKSHELIKVRVLGEDRRQRKSLVPEICQALEAHPVQQVGKIIVLYRQRPDPEPGPAPPRHQKHRSKRSQQR